jgi:hypothetical protein
VTALVVFHQKPTTGDAIDTETSQDLDHTFAADQMSKDPDITPNLMNLSAPASGVTQLSATAPTPILEPAKDPEPLALSLLPSASQRTREKS